MLCRPQARAFMADGSDELELVSKLAAAQVMAPLAEAEFLPPLSVTIR